MKLGGLIRRLAALEPEPGKDCPHCRAVASMTDEELDQGIRELLAGRHSRLAEIESSPMCSYCQKMAAMSEEELDVQLARLIDIAEKAGVR